MENVVIEKEFKPKFNIKPFAGFSLGCFIGTSYGVFIGFGKIFHSGNGMCIVYPSRNPFLHKGYISGCYCGLALGAGFNTGILYNFGIKKNLEIPVSNLANFYQNFFNFDINF